MQKIGDVPNSNADSNGEWTEGNPQSGVPATIMAAGWLNTIQRELVKLVQGFGQNLDPESDQQVFDILQSALNGKANAFHRAYKDEDAHYVNASGLFSDPDLHIGPLEDNTYYKVSGFLKIALPSPSGGARVDLVALDNHGFNSRSSFSASYVMGEAPYNSERRLLRPGKTFYTGSSSEYREYGIEFSGFILTGDRELGGSIDNIWQVKWGPENGTSSASTMFAGSWIQAEELRP